MSRSKIVHGADGKEKEKMAVLAKPVNQITVIKEKDSQKFVREFNNNKITEEFVKSCKKAADLFAGKK